MKTTTTTTDRQGLKYVPTAWPTNSAPLSKKRLTRSSDWNRWNRCPNLAFDNGYFLAKPYSVTCWGSHPDEGGDDCWTSQDFATLAEADDALVNWETVFPHSVGETTHLELSAWTGQIVGGLAKYETVAVRQVKTDAQIRKMKQRNDADDRDWQREIAMQAGMAGGCDAYNEAMGWD